LRYLVTGGAGFLGSHLSQLLLNQGHEVLAVDNLYTGSKDNFQEFRSHARFEFLRHDITFPLYVEVDGIFNLACPASPVHYQKFPVQTIKTSILGSINMLGLAKRLKVPILQASTSEVYGDPEVSPQREDYWGHVNPIGLRACYDEGKRAAESLFFDYQRQFGLDIKVARIFNTYGPKMSIDDGRVVSNFILQALRGEDLTLFGDGSQTRSFCYVSDLITAIYSLMNLSMPLASPINIGNPTEYKMVELAQKIVRITKSKSKITFLPLPLDDPKQRKPDITLVRQILDWSPQIDLESGLGLTVDYFRKK